jgi:hypothetical protein
LDFSFEIKEVVLDDCIHSGDFKQSSLKNNYYYDHSIYRRTIMFRTLSYLAFCFLFVSGFSRLAEGAGMVAHWRLENDATDSAGNIDGTLTNGAGFTTDAVEGNYALVLKSSQQQYVDFGNPPELPDGRSPRSMCAWAKTNTTASGWRWIAAYGSEGTSLAMFIGMNGSSLYGGGYGDDVYVNGF